MPSLCFPMAPQVRRVEPAGRSVGAGCAGVEDVCGPGQGTYAQFPLSRFYSRTPSVVPHYTHPDGAHHTSHPFYGARHLSHMHHPYFVALFCCAQKPSSIAQFHLSPLHCLSTPVFIPPPLLPPLSPLSLTSLPLSFDRCSASTNTRAFSTSSLQSRCAYLAPI